MSIFKVRVPEDFLNSPKMMHCTLQPFNLIQLVTFAVSEMRPSTPDVL